MHSALSQGHLSVVKFLVSKGADIMACDNHGKTPLFYATKCKKTEVCSFLQQKEKEYRSNRMQNK